MDDRDRIFLEKQVDFDIRPGYIWTPVRTKPRQEKKLAEYCIANSIEEYLPLRKSVRRYGRKNFEFQVPMFSGYIFCRISQDSFQRLILSKAYFYRIQMDEMLEKVLVEELKSIRMMEQLTRESMDVVVRPEIVEGTLVNVKKGPFRGISGIVTRRKGKTEITVNIEILGQSVTAKIDIEDLEINQ